MHLSQLSITFDQCDYHIQVAFQCAWIQQTLILIMSTKNIECISVCSVCNVNVEAKEKNSIQYSRWLTLNSSRIKTYRIVTVRYRFAWFQAIDFGCETVKKWNENRKKYTSIQLSMNICCLLFICFVLLCFTCNYEKCYPSKVNLFLSFPIQCEPIIKWFLF